MPRKLRSKSRTITARGERKFTGEFPCSKSEHPLVFDSITALLVGVWLEYRRDIVRVDFESKVSRYSSQDESEFNAVHDYDVTYDSGELGIVEAKYSIHALRQQEAERLEVIASSVRGEGKRFEVGFRKELEEDGFIWTVLTLRRYGLMQFPESTLNAAISKLGKPRSLDVNEWLRVAQKGGVSLAVVWHLAYHQRIAVKFRPLTCMELEKCLESSV